VTPTLSAPVLRTRTGTLLAIVLTAQFMAMLDTNIVNVAAATIQTSLGASGPALQLVLAGYTIAYAVLLITGARIGSLLGYRRTFLLGLLAFTVASAACGLALSTGELIAFRFAQGVGAALIIPQVFSFIQVTFTGPARARALGWYAAVISVGVVAGQILGGLLSSANLFGTGWRPIFLANVPIGVALLVLGRRLPVVDPPSYRRLDLPGLVLLSLAVLSFVVALLFGPLLLLVLCALFVVAFGLVQRSSTSPLMPLRLLRSPGLLPSLAALVAMMVSYGGFMFTVALYLQEGLGYSPLLAGLSFVPNAICFGLTGMLLPRRSLIPVGLAVAAVSMVLIAFFIGDPWVYLAMQVPAGIGSALAFSPLMARALARVAPADASDASGLLTTNVQLAQVVGVATLGSLYLTSGLTVALLGCAVMTGVASVMSLPFGRSLLRPFARAAAPSGSRMFARGPSAR
jgi:MFS family permease